MRQRLHRVRTISLRRLLLGLVVLAAVIGGSTGGYLASQHTTNQESRFGDFSNPNRVEVNAWITRVDPVGQVFWMTVIDVRPFGSLADPDGNFPADVMVITNAVGNWRTTIKAGDSSPDIEQEFTIGGSITDYPFDRYTSSMELRVVDSRGNDMPTTVTVKTIDNFFRTSMSQVRAAPGWTAINLEFHRSTPTLVFASFIMVLMLGLASAAAIAAYYILDWKRGLVFNACSMMAAILFALIPLRNAVPGSPPIGSIIDFGSFFIAEAVISISLISSILIGFRHQMAIELAESQASEAPQDATPGKGSDDPLGGGHAVGVNVIEEHADRGDHRAGAGTVGHVETMPGTG